MKIVFLDLDGVLNGHERFENGYYGIRQENVAELNFLLKSVPTAKIVLISSWRYMLYDSMTLDGFTNLLLSHGVNCLLRERDKDEPRLSKLIGATQFDET